ncbi:MAG: hypothetical protein MUE37_13080 [Bacteroidales bacterium]|nr:hypothetical protein [Bacteroidales bacterium]
MLTEIENISASDQDHKQWVLDKSTMSTYIGERFSNQCFFLLSPILHAPGTDKPPEYIFKGSYESEIEGGRIIEYAEDYKKPVVARMDLKLYYNGNTPELVQEWSSENTINDPEALFNKLKTPKSLQPLFEEFEKKPVSFDVEVPLQEDLCQKGKGEIILSGFRDISGRASRDFNRIVVSIYKGRILNGADSDFGPDYKVFTVGEGEIRIEYQPPEDKDDGYEWLRVYNSCDILPEGKYPMSRTIPDELIVDQHFPISCGFYQGTITVTMRWDYTKDHGKSSSRHVGSQTVSYSGIFKPIPQMEGMEGQPIKMFGKGSVTGTWQYEAKRYCEGDCDCSGLVYEEHGGGSVDGLSMDALMVITNSWPTDDKVVADQLKQFGMANWYDINTPSSIGQTNTRTRSKNKDGQCVWHNSESEVYIVESNVRFKLEDINKLSGKESWGSSTGTTAISITNLTEAVYDQPPFDPEQDGTDYHYTITWNLKAY